MSANLTRSRCNAPPAAGRGAGDSVITRARSDGPHTHCQTAQKEGPDSFSCRDPQTAFRALAEVRLSGPLFDDLVHRTPVHEHDAPGDGHYSA